MNTEATPGEDEVMNASVTPTPSSAALKFSRSFRSGSRSLTSTAPTHCGRRIGWSPVMRAILARKSG